MGWIDRRQGSVAAWGADRSRDSTPRGEPRWRTRERLTSARQSQGDRLRCRWRCRCHILWICPLLGGGPTRCSMHFWSMMTMTFSPAWRDHQQEVFAVTLAASLKRPGVHCPGAGRLVVVDLMCPTGTGTGCSRTNESPGDPRALTSSSLGCGHLESASGVASGALYSLVNPLDRAA